MLIFILWLVAAHDKGTDRECHGPVQLYNDYLDSLTGDTKTYLQNHNNAYSLLVAFGVICGTFWLAVGVIGLLANTERMAKVVSAADNMKAGITIFIFS